MKKYLIATALLIFIYQKSYSQDPAMPQEKSIIYLSNNKQIKNAKLWNVHGAFLEYEKDGSLHDVALNKIDKIKCGDDEYGILNDTLTKVVFTANSTAVTNNAGTVIINTTESLPVASPTASINYYLLGREDAKKYYSATGPFVWSLITGPYAAPIIAAIPPNNPGKYNPNGALYYNNQEYHRGFKNAAHGKKALHALAGLGGWLLFVLMVTAG